MTYRGAEVQQNDCGSIAISAVAVYLKKEVFSSLDPCIDKKTAETSAIATFKCLRLIGREFPREVACAFGTKDAIRFEQRLKEWHDLAKENIPAKYRDQVLVNGLEEARLFAIEVSTRA